MRRSIEKQQGSEREREREKEVKVVETQGARGEGGRQRESAALVSPHRSSGSSPLPSERVKSAAVEHTPSGSEPLPHIHTYTHSERVKSAGVEHTPSGAEANRCCFAP